jgi:hypothetical protein
MTQQYVDSLEEVFFERNFDFGDDPETIQDNLNKAQALFSEYEEKANKLAEDVEDGIAFDESDAILITQSYVFAKKFMERFQSELSNTQSSTMAVGAAY